MALAHLTINLDAFTGDDHPPVPSYSTITLDPGADHIDAANDVIHVRTIVVSLDRQGKAATANGVPCVDGKVPVVAGVAYAVSAPTVLRGGPHYIPALTAGQVVDLSDYITPGAPLTPDQAATLTARIVALETTPPDHGALTGLGDDDHAQYALADGTRGAFAAPLGADDNYVTDAEKAALHGHSNKAALDLVSGENTGDQVLPTWSTISGKPAVVAQGATQADARAAIGAGTSNLTIGTTGTTAAAGNRAATETATGMVELATTTEATTGTDTVRAVTPAGVKAVADTKANVSHTHTASQVSDSTATGRALVTATDAAAARGTLGLATVAATGAYADLTGKPTTMTPTAHASTHASGGSDPLAVTNLGVGSLADGQMLVRSGSALVGQAVPSGGGGGLAWSGVNVGNHLPVWANGGHGGFTMVTTRIIPCPLVAVEAMNVDAVSIYVNTGVATSTIDLALYTYNLAAGVIGLFVQHLATIDTSTAGLKTATFAPIALAAGIHVVVARANNANVVLWGVASSMGICRMKDPGGGNNQYGFPHATWTGAVPSWPSSPTWDWNAGVSSIDAQVPKLQLRRSA